MLTCCSTRQKNVWLANYGKEDSSDPIVPKINQEMLAEMIGTSRSHVSFFMNKFRHLGFIDYNGNLKVHRSLSDMLLHQKTEDSLARRVI